MADLVPALRTSAPVAQSERIVAIDVLRGFAVLGILVMNIQSFAMIGSAYINPTAYGDLTGINYAVWLLGHLLCDMKFMSIFSMLFGAGILLVSGRREQAGGRATGLHYRRMAWLLLFGLMHGYFIWYGDILYTYAVCGMGVYLLRRRRPWTLILIGILVLSVGSLISISLHFSMQNWPVEAVNEMAAEWKPSEETMQSEIDAYRGGWVSQMSNRAEAAFFFQTILFLLEFVWRAGGLMLLGMGLFKLDFFSARKPTSVYLGYIFAALLIGLPLTYYGVRRNEAINWDFRSSFFLGSQFNYWASLLVSLGWVSLIMLVCKSGGATKLTSTLAAVGQMAFTNYILQSVMCTFIFYGHGLGQFGHIERIGQAAIIAGVFSLQLLISPLWLRYFRFGPLEWMWRSLTYGQRQPMRRSNTGSTFD